MSSYSTTMKRSLEIELISAEGLRIDRKPVKKKTFCVVKIDEKRRDSKLDELGGSYPIWNDKIETELPINGSVRYISIEVFYRTSGGCEKSIGYAKIPITDFMGGFAPHGHLNFLSYRLRDEYGDKSGIVNVSIMVKPNGGDNNKYWSSPSSSSTVVAPVDYAKCSSQATVNGQMWRQKASTSSMSGYGGRVVTGVPVGCAYQQS
ncbi:unnamed protein product [Arabis nemorensis]|uniref:C2 domain-containing protein n=1 Tax=Arabis nemorensis TaxID=586526 RepID=A0A565BPE3_9BRAS|nr:unnamed protein product [Arabis nemorensis]